MKASRRGLLLASAVFSALSVLFLFVNVLWASDRGVALSFSFPVSGEKGVLSLLSDLCYLLAPLGGVAASLLALKTEKKTVLLLLPTLPLGLYTITQGILLWDKDFHFYELFTLGFLFFLSILFCAAAKEREYLPFGAFFALFYLVLEILLGIATFLLGKKLSYFCFTQLIPFSRYSYFRYSYVVISVFLVFFFLCLALTFFALSQIPKQAKKEKATHPHAKENTPENEGEAKKEAEKETAEENEEAEDAPLSLEDFGIER